MARSRLWTARKLKKMKKKYNNKLPKNGNNVAHLIVKDNRLVEMHEMQFLL